MTPQRRALIVAAASPQQLVGIETRPDLVIAADSGLHAVLAAGWIPDRVIGDLDSADPAAVEIAAEGGAVVDRHPVGKDETDLELALAAAVEAGAVAILTDERPLDDRLEAIAASGVPTWSTRSRSRGAERLREPGKFWCSGERPMA